MGYTTEITGTISYQDAGEVEQQVIEKIVAFIESVQWYCSASYRDKVKVDYYTYDTEWIHYCSVHLDKTTKQIDLSGDRKNYHLCIQTLLYYIAPYLNRGNTYNVTLQGEDEEDYSEVEVTNGSVLVNGELFETDNQLAFPLPQIEAR